MRSIKLLLLVLVSALAACSNKTIAHSASGRLIKVSNEGQLTAALADARPGDNIILAEGTYPGNFVIKSTASGTATSPITVTGSRKAIIDGGDIRKGYALHLQADHWIVKGITIKRALKGIIIDGGHFNTIDGVNISEIGEEGIHFRKFSTHNTLQNSEISNTGQKTADYGEGVYIGSAVSNWSKYSDGVEDRCDSNIIDNNKIGPNCTAECIDVKEGTTGNIIRKNHFDATGITGANSGDSWMDVKGNYTIIENNVGFNPAGSVLTDGYQVHCAADGWGSYNEFKNNDATVNGPGYGFNIVLKSSKGDAIENKVYSNNKVSNAAKGVTNIPITQ